VIPDRDGDTVPDLVDNCPDVANPRQSDVDSDRRGDACDNCPVLANPEQEDIGEMPGVPDGVGDVCDPGPTFTGDCLLLFDSFRDATAFASSWRAVPAQVGDLVTVTDEGLAIGANAGRGRVAVFSTEVGAEATGVQALATKPDLDEGEAGIATQSEDDGVPGIACWLASEATGSGLAVHAQIGTAVSPEPVPLSNTPVIPSLTLRLHVPRELLAAAVQCRADFGVAVGTTRMISGGPTPLLGPGAGMFASDKPLVVRALALYGTTGTEPCPVTIVH
jgi:hypothetical protein